MIDDFDARAEPGEAERVGPDAFTAARTSLRGGMTARIYQVKYPNKNLTIIIYQMPDGKIEQYLIAEQ